VVAQPFVEPVEEALHREVASLGVVFDPLRLMGVKVVVLRPRALAEMARGLQPLAGLALGALLVDVVALGEGGGAGEVEGTRGARADQGSSFTRIAPPRNPMPTPTEN